MTIKMTIAYNLWFLQKDRSGTMVEQLKHFYMIHSHGCQFWVDQKQKKHDLESLFICTQNLTICFGCFMIRNRKVDRKNHQLVIGEFVEKPRKIGDHRYHAILGFCFFMMRKFTKDHRI